MQSQRGRGLNLKSIEYGVIIIMFLLLFFKIE